MSANMENISDANYEEIINSETPVVIDFWAPWCGPCRMVSPIMEQLAEEYDGKIIFTKMNTDENPSTPGRLGIRGIPTVIIYSNGKEVDRTVGVAPKPVFKGKLDNILVGVTEEA